MSAVVIPEEHPHQYRTSTAPVSAKVPQCQYQHQCEDQDQSVPVRVLGPIPLPELVHMWYVMAGWQRRACRSNPAEPHPPCWEGSSA